MAGIFAKKADFVVSSNGISSFEKIILGGIEQAVLIQSDNIENPVLLVIHGGPSLPLPGVSSRGRDYTIVTNTKELVRHYTVVFWDQRGTGKSYNKHIPQESMNIKQFVSDANELTDYLIDRFGQEKIFLAGHSWGSTVGLTLASTYPQKFHSYVGLSQIVSWTENDRQSLQWLKNEAKRRGNKKAIRELDSVGEPPFLESFEQWGVIRQWQQRFNTITYSDHEIKHPGLVRITFSMFQSPDYTLKDIYHTFVKGFKLVYHQAFIEELASNNFAESVKELPIPITFIHGRKDFHVNGKVVENYVGQLKAERGKRLIWAEKSAHAFHPDDTKLIEQYLIDEKKHLSHLPENVEKWG
ncbi:alpha/beta hydrolase [Neobacillus notoginsengisoli]|uniref:Alpha/beta hydrolase n=1 Tax=Neobacillus notoginsengisoli TaxID=1578198 RepID=A0A417YX89_9BACI|nr:alpha/beta hydrolase [Neobacillus notoginsengisoli]RHW42025.1 alpha/beta hydrolase [Neobacillus notoginsengisoli]